MNLLSNQDKLLKTSIADICCIGQQQYINDSERYRRGDNVDMYILTTDHIDRNFIVW